MYLIDNEYARYNWIKNIDNKEDFKLLTTTPNSLKLLHGSYIHINDIDLGVENVYLNIGSVYVKYKGCSRDAARMLLESLDSYIDFTNLIEPKITGFINSRVYLNYESTIRNKGYSATILIPFSLIDLVTNNEDREKIQSIIFGDSYYDNYNIDRYDINNTPHITLFDKKLNLISIHYNRSYKRIELVISNTEADPLFSAARDPIFSILQNNKLNILVKITRLLTSWSKRDRH